MLKEIEASATDMKTCHYHYNLEETHFAVAQMYAQNIINTPIAEQKIKVMLLWKAV